MKGSVVILTMIASMGLVSAAPSQAQSMDRIAFHARWSDDPEAPWEIYSMDLDGSDWVNLSNRSSDEIDPAWSPDGAKIAFASDRTGSFQIYVMDADGSNQVQLTIGPGDHLWPAWSPDGTQLAYSSDEGGVYDIYVMQADGSDAVNVTMSPGVDYAPSWSPDGTRLSFSSDRDRQRQSVIRVNQENMKIFPIPNDVFVMDALGGAATNLTLGFDARANLDPIWSRATARIAFLQMPVSGGGEYVLRIIDPAGGEGGLVEVTDAFVFEARTPSWSRDGSMLVYSSAIMVPGRVQTVGLWVVSASGGPPRQLTGVDWVALHPTWSPMSAGSPSTNVEQALWGELKRRFRQGRGKAEGAPRLSVP